MFFIPKQVRFCINPLRLKTSITPYRPKAHNNLFGKDTILCGITCPIIKSLFRKNTLKYVEAVKDCTITSDLQLKRKLHLGIQMLITATYSECIIINYIYYYSSRTSDSFAGGPISVDYSIRKLQHVIEKRVIKSYKNSQNLLLCDVSACILSYKNSIAISLVWVWRRFHVELNGLYSRFIAPGTREL